MKRTTHAASDDDSSPALRVIAYNVFHARGWPEDRAQAEHAPGRGGMAERLARELARYEPNILTFSESPDQALMEDVAQRLGMHHVRFPSAGQWPGTLLSRFPVIDSTNAPMVAGERAGDLFTRHWGRATLRLPGGESLIVHSAHLYPRIEHAGLRQREIAAMLEQMAGDRRADRSMLLMGDLNHTPDARENRMLTEAGWVDTFIEVGKGPGFTIKADQPTKRIDYIMAAGPIAKRLTEARPLFEGVFRTNPNDATSFALSDHLPQFAAFESPAVALGN